MNLSGDPATIMNKITSTSCLVLVYRDSCPLCVDYKPIFLQASKMASLLADFYLIDSTSPAVAVADELVKQFTGSEIEGVPMTLVMCETCSGPNKKSKLVDVWAGPRSLTYIIDRAAEVCPAMKK